MFFKIKQNDITLIFLYSSIFKIVDELSRKNFNVKIICLSNYCRLIIYFNNTHFLLYIMLSTC